MLDSISRTLARIKADILAQRNIEAYVVAALAIVLAVLGVVDAGVSLEVKIAVLLAAASLLVFNLTVPEIRDVSLDDVLQDRDTFRFLPVDQRIKEHGIRTLWVYGVTPVAIFSNDSFLTAIRKEIMEKGGEVRVIMQDPKETEVIKQLKVQLDEATQHPVHSVETNMNLILQKCRQITSWDCSKGTFEYRFLPYYPGFSLIIFNPRGRNGVAIPEVHGYFNIDTNSRMHLEITEEQSKHWYEYWINQFEHMWEKARKPGETDESAKS